MIGATIDIYHEEICVALSAKDDRRIAEIAACFYERHNHYKPWRLVDCRVGNITGSGVRVEMDIQFVSGKLRSTFATVAIFYKDGKQRVTVDGEEIVRGRMDQVVEALEVPMAFLDGVYFFAQHFEGEVHSGLGKAWMEFRRVTDQVNHLASHRDKLSKRIKELERRVEMVSPNAGGKAVSFIDVSGCADSLRSQFLSLVPQNMLFEVSDARRLMEGKAGVYFAWCVATGKCVYVGKSKNLGSRLSPSRHELRGCRMTVLEMPEHDIHLWELFYIWLLKPERNGQASDRRVFEEA